MVRMMLFEQPVARAVDVGARGWSSWVDPENAQSLQHLGVHGCELRFLCSGARLPLLLLEGAQFRFDGRPPFGREEPAAI